MLFAGQHRGGRSGASQKGCLNICGYLLVLINTSQYLRIYEYLLVLTNTWLGFCGARCGQGRQNWIGGIHNGGRETIEMIKQASNKGMTHCTKITELRGLEEQKGVIFNTDTLLHKLTTIKPRLWFWQNTGSVDPSEMVYELCCTTLWTLFQF